MKATERRDVALDIVTTQPLPHAVAMWWLGQASVVLRVAGMTVYIDPFLSEYPDRLAPPLFSPGEAAPADYILCTHEHVDHFDLQTLPGMAQISPRVRFVVPLHLVEQVTALGISADRVLGTQPGEVLHLGPLTLLAVPACHGLKAPPARYGFDFVEHGGKHLYRYLGYILEIAGVRIYHAGDTVIYDSLVERLREQEVDVAFLPINGRSYFREQKDIVGNMDEREAADLAAAAGVKLLVPIHYDMFAANQGRPGILVDYIQASHSGLTCLIPAPGRRFTFVKGDGR
ncbi:MAG: MBL fold metallo-hydrolase [Ktedonobacteraceae bacterium]|nr:MBL fold metallo-hydrolase [Ktedonobacteraceae bacterium]